jgi:hypothetical protein
MQLEKLPLGREGLAYVEECLQAGAGLCTKFLGLGFAGGEVFASVPEGTSLERAKSFNTGGLMRRRDADAWLAEHIVNLRRPGANGTLILQDIWMKPSGLVVQRPRVKGFSDGESVYYCLSQDETNFDFLQSAMRAMASYLFIGFFSRVSVQCEGQPTNHVVSTRLINEIAEATEEVFVGAYDQEGLVVWRKIVNSL